MVNLGEPARFWIRHQIGDAGVARRALDVRGRTVPKHLAGVQHHQAVGEHARFVQVMRHEHDGDRQFRPQIGQQPVEPLAVHLVDGREGIVEQQQPGHARDFCIRKELCEAKLGGVSRGWPPKHGHLQGCEPT